MTTVTKGFLVCTLFTSLFMTSSAQLPLLNSPRPLVIPTYDGSGQGMHPCIIDFQSQYNKSSWGGYRYWMVMTPAPYKQRFLENPSLIGSQDGIHWIVPDGMKTPLVNCTPPENNADPDMIYNPTTNELWLYFDRANHKQKVGAILLIKIKENFTMTDPQVLFQWDPQNFDSAIVSPCIWMESPSRWHMWGVFVNYPNPFVYKFSSDGIHWDKTIICQDDKGGDPFPSKGYRPWHQSCKPNYKEHRIEFIVASRTNISKNYPQSLTDCLVYAQCPMDHPGIVTLPLQSPLLIKSDTGWDNQLVYRTTFIIDDMHFGYRYRIWYSACDKKDRWGIGFIQGFLGTDNTLSQPKKMISKLYPLPSRDKCLVKIQVHKVKTLAELVLYDQYGSRIESRQLTKGKNNVHLDLSQLQRNTYSYVINIDSTYIEGDRIPLLRE